MRARLRLLLSLALIGGCLLSNAARCADDPSVLVQLTQLKQGSLPRLVTAYGTVQASAPAQRAVMAPAGSIVDEIYVRPGEEVDRGAPLVRLRPTPEVASAYAQAETALRAATETVQRMRSMVAQHLATAQQLLDARKAETDARVALTALQALGAGGAKVLSAPHRAVVTGVAARPGGIVAAGATLLSLADPGGLMLEVGALAAQAQLVKPDDPVAITPVGQAETLSGKVLFRGSMIDPATGLIPIQIGFPAGKLLVGEAATVSITTGQVSGYVVPHAAILVDGHGATYVVQAVRMAAKHVPVRILAADGNRDVIDGPLDPAAPLVLTGNYQLQDGMKIRTANPPAKAGQ